MKSYFTLFSIFMFIIFSVPSIISDIKSLVVRSLSIYLGTAALAVTCAFYCPSLFIPSIISCAVLFLIFLLTHFIVKDKLGFGDVKYSMLCGFASGHILWALSGLGIACVLALLVFALLKLSGKTETVKKLPFVPFLFAGVLAIMILRLVFGF